MITLYGYTGSGNCYKPALAMRQLGIAHQWREVDILKGESRTPAFLAKNANGRIPLLEPEPGRYLAESNAMLCWLAEGTPLLPADRWARAKVLEWLFFEQYSHEPYIATVRYWVAIEKSAEANQARIAERMPRGYAALGVMEAQLAKTPYLAGENYTIADIALYAYTHVADEGGFDLADYPAVRTWLARIKATPGFVTMAASAG
ncbi:glutathione S-transferase family protein [uncultured Nevskia sp.]|uniref:glutathione S-transferase family protein n=1 Tax=uncultured Nevskia sp. TaxID=228950 RepID=UPI0025D4E3E2|nr:glutathione S-transferase family protein [uncultured Nevskia sp.]